MERSRGGGEVQEINGIILGYIRNLGYDNSFLFLLSFLMITKNTN
jgi:hypothetical protein